MKTKITFIAAIILLSFSCKGTPEGIPSGTWKYNLIVNGVIAGTANITNEKSDGVYTIKSEMLLTVGTIENRSVQIIRETDGFRPVSLEVLNTVKDSRTGRVQEINKTATFSGNKVLLKSGDYKSEFTIDEPFILDGNYFFTELLKNGFKKGTVVKASIYEPTVELEEPILVIVEMAGYENIDVNGKTKNLIHIKQKVEKLKSMDVYLNESGVTEKVVIKMLNNIFELVMVD